MTTSTKYNAIILQANHAEFGPRDTFIYPYVQSRLLIWGKSGHGIIIVNGKTYNVYPGIGYFTPWEHSISYYPSAQDPFIVGGIHLIPDYSRSAPLEFQIPHNRNDFDQITCRDSRNDRPDILPDEIIPIDLRQAKSIELLIEYFVERFHRDVPSEEELRFFGEQLMSEVVFYKDDIFQGTGVMPGELKKLTDYILANLDRQLTTEILSMKCNYSKSTVNRLFRTYTGESPLSWIIRQKLDKAARLLSSSNMSNSEIGEKIGIDDQYYFSKLFKKHYGITATEYRRKKHFIKPSAKDE